MFNVFEKYREFAESMSAAELKREIARFDRKLEVIGKEVDALIPQVTAENEWLYKSKVKDCRFLADAIRAFSEELAIRGAA